MVDGSPAVSLSKGARRIVAKTLKAGVQPIRIRWEVSTAIRQARLQGRRIVTTGDLQNLAQVLDDIDSHA
ncbi:MAG: hypothetical protein HY376_02635 [Candidatus Blackburnbacteria bacterium]|nr:hypothetical protein [Candidatus Blackburnbacteria bacterium]